EGGEVIVVAAAIYRAMLRGYPRWFRQTFQDDLEQDFEDGSRDAFETGGARALGSFWLCTSADLVVSVTREWLRTPWLPVLIAAATLSLGLFAWTTMHVNHLSHALFWPPRRGADTDRDQLAMLILLIVGTLIPIVGTILGSLWMLLLRRS